MGAGAAGLAAALPARAQRGGGAPGVAVPPASFISLKPDARGVVRFAVDVAVIGNSDAIDPSGRIGPKDSQNYFNIDVRGDTYYVEGALYPEGTIPTPTVPTRTRRGTMSVQQQLTCDFTGAEPAGHWLSRGWVLINGEKKPSLDSRGTPVEGFRTEPHLLSTHNYVFGRFGPDSLSPEMLVSQGTEDGNDPDKEVMVRAITGGTGRFKFARGQVVETRLGRNTTTVRSFSQFPEAYSPNYRFAFELKLD